ncbi:glycerol-3-phosphate 1-O-acyltransferase PlsY [Desulfovibrio aminophilus]|nr:glycerol-3-phosphate 1-O-acyltransferase PlsY [Desulfovibrio aminophilus]MCM0753782.1 glycerol-3-phosphate 1-O-acyltransferase PlsY [Desulfovibrio aminophilus]
MTLLWMVLAYLLGSVPFGLILAKTLCGVDPREDGSRNTGATNVARLCGTKYGVLVLALDILKGYAPAALAVSGHAGATSASLVALCAILGHVYSPWLHFKGGKAVATTIGAFLALMPLGTILSVLACVGIIALTGYVSLGSLTLALCLPVFALLTGKIAFLPLALVVMLLLFWRHRENIRRLARGEEMPWRRKKESE